MKKSVKAFVRNAGWGDSVSTPLAGDASQRSYQRLTRTTGERAVLMCASADGEGETARFVTVARHLRQLGLSAPEILAEDTSGGVLLLEDLGDDLFSQVAPVLKDGGTELYSAAVDLLARLHLAPAPGFASALDRQVLVEMVGPVFEWYAGGSDGTGVSGELGTLFASIRDLTDVLSLRDFHSENLIWLPERVGHKRVGLLDFQDAVTSHRAYDLVSLLRDARRDLSPGLAERMTERYVRISGVESVSFRRAMAVYGVQRNLRILGVFARLARRDGKPGYLRFVPRVWGHLLQDLSHPGLSDLREEVLTTLPAPDDAHLERLAS